MSHEWTDYSQVQDLYADGHEIASHTITHSHGTNFNEEKWANEVVGEAEMLVRFAGVNPKDIKGMRAPFLAVGGTPCSTCSTGEKILSIVCTYSPLSFRHMIIKKNMVDLPCCMDFTKREI